LRVLVGVDTAGVVGVVIGVVTVVLGLLGAGAEVVFGGQGLVWVGVTSVGFLVHGLVVDVLTDLVIVGLDA
jgi:hypothetical protein